MGWGDVRWSSRSLALGLLSLLSALGCEEPEDRIQGQIESDTPLIAPVSSTPTCAAQIRGREVRRYATGNGARSSTHFTSPWRYAPGARFVVDGRAYTITGVGGGPRGSEQGERWTGRPAPPALADYGSEGASVVRCHGEPPPETPCTYRYRDVYEYLVPCGTDTSLQGEIQGDTFALHRETNPTGTAFAFGVMGTFALCVMCPVLGFMALAFGLIVRSGWPKKSSP